MRGERYVLDVHKAMRLMVLAVLLSGCAEIPRVITYPSGLKIVRLEQRPLNKACGDGPRDGETAPYHGDVEGCFMSWEDTIYVLDSCIGAKALTHEMAHREGIAEPSKDGFDW